MSATTGCPVCGGAGRPTLQLSAQVRLQECRGCAVGWLNPMPTDEELAAAYPEEAYYAFTEVGDNGGGHSAAYHLRQQFRRWAYEGHFAPCPSWAVRLGHRLVRGRYGRGLPLRMQRGRLLDVGCGDGFFLQYCRRSGWQVTGVEWSAAAARRAQAAGLDVRAGNFVTVELPSASFDVIRLWHVLEHVRDPRAALQKAARLLAPDGELIVGVPNARSVSRWLFGRHWIAWDWPRHLYHFSAAGLHRLMAAEGFHIVRLQYRSVGTGVASLGVWATRVFPLLGLGIIADTACDTLQVGDCLEVHAVRS